jgi:hypothetical protein
MDFVERWFGFSPDGGSGTLEATLMVIALVVLAAPFLIHQIRSGTLRLEKRFKR